MAPGSTGAIAGLAGYIMSIGINHWLHQLPSAAIFALHKLIRLIEVGNLHVRAVPHQFYVSSGIIKLIRLVFLRM